MLAIGITTTLATGVTYAATSSSGGAKACVNSHQQLALRNAHGACAHGYTKTTIGAVGPKGPRGKQGVKGNSGSGGLVGYELTVSTAVASTGATSNNSASETMFCPPNTVVLGGGFTTDDANLAINVEDDGPDHNDGSWVVNTTSSSATVYHLTTWIECAQDTDTDTGRRA